MTEKPHRKSRLHGAVARYRDARRSLHTPASPQSRYGLDWMNFFVADVQTGFVHLLPFTSRIATGQYATSASS